uniref:Uncharacterized protein n=1 Tax=Megaselia scalaris TaxID=36166 RepID=T1GCJ1_MEGSC
MSMSSARCLRNAYAWWHHLRVWNFSETPPAAFTQLQVSSSLRNPKDSKDISSPVIIARTESEGVFIRKPVSGTQMLRKRQFSDISIRLCGGEFSGTSS